jgi:hypothetical protein
VSETRPAQPGDLFLLLEPSEAERAAVRELQAALQVRYGGRPQAYVHLTCQRFALDGGPAVESVIASLRAALSGSRPLSIRATSFIDSGSPFWQTRLLRWRIEPTDELLAFRALIDRTLQGQGIAPHYPWTSFHVTALEGVIGREGDALSFEDGLPRSLFVARQVVLSRLRGQFEFDLLAEIDLAG